MSAPIKHPGLYPNECSRCSRKVQRRMGTYGGSNGGRAPDARIGVQGTPQPREVEGRQFCFVRALAITAGIVGYLALLIYLSWLLAEWAW